MSELGLEQGQGTDQQPQESEARRRGRPPNSAKPQQQGGANFDMITYLPIMGDPIEVTWHGILFPANIPVKVLRSVTYKVPMPVRSPMKDEDGKQMFEEDDEGEPVLDARGRKKPRYHNGHLQPDGTLQTRMVETDVPLATLAKGNCRFSVNGAPPAFSDKKGVARTPETVAEYRKYAMDWIAGADNKLNMTQRWKNEAPLRAELGWTGDDDGYLMPFFDARLVQAAA
jgi:hypothetical protein